MYARAYPSTAVAMEFLVCFMNAPAVQPEVDPSDFNADVKDGLEYQKWPTDRHPTTVTG